ncbi:MAG: LamG domain-containing protein [Dehalococcoidales bacterium]|nr:LamG domain-containing protein [Dehalococcoidales bacterium]
MKPILTGYFIIIVMALLIPSALALGTDISDAQWLATVTVSNNSTSTKTNQAVIFLINATSMINQGFCNSSLTDVAMFDNVPDFFMPGYGANPWCVFIPSITGSANNNYDLYTKGAVSTSTVYFPGDTGLTVPDILTEPGNDFEFTLNNVWTDTTNGTGRYLLNKVGAMCLFVSPTVSQNVTLGIYDPNALDFEAANNDAVTIPDHNDFTFGAGGVDKPFSITAWVKQESDTGTSETIASKYGAAAAAQEWHFHLINGKPSLLLISSAGNYLRLTSSVSIENGSWYHVAVTYDGSETINGIKLYINGVLDTAAVNSSLGAYAGMPNTATDVMLGNVISLVYDLDGTLSNVKIFDVELTGTQINIDCGSAGEGVVTDLVAWYKLMDGAGNPADSSGNGHNASANTADWVTTGGTFISVSLTETGVATGEHDYKISLTGGTLSLQVDSEAPTTAAFAGSINNSTSKWTLFRSTCVLYAASANYSQGGTPIAAYAWEYDSVFHDTVSANGTPDATPSFRTTGTDEDLSATVSSFQPLSSAEASAAATTGNLTIIGDPDAPSELYTEGDYSAIPGAEAVNAILDASGTPRAMWWHPFLFLGIALVGFMLYGATTGTVGQSSSAATHIGSLLLQSIVTEVLFGVFGVMHVLPLFPVYIFPIGAIAIILSTKHYSYG